MKNRILTRMEIEKLKHLERDMRHNLSCNINGNCFPCRTCRFAAIKSMITYLKIHNYKVVKEK